jgi:hypothetical protein
MLNVQASFLACAFALVAISSALHDGASTAGSASFTCPAAALGAADLSARADVRSLIPRSTYTQGRVQSILARGEADTVVLLSISWDGPAAGALVLVNCFGATLAVANSGYVDSMALLERPFPNGLVRAYGHTNGATGYSTEGVQVWSFADHLLVSSWYGRTNEVSSSGISFEEKATVNFRPPNAIVRKVVARSGSGRADSGRLTALRQEFIWDPARREFLPVH